MLDAAEIQRRTAISQATRNELLRAAVTEAGEVGYLFITKPAIGRRAHRAASLINHYFGSLSDLKDAVVSYAVEMEVLPIVTQALANGHPIALSAPDDLKHKASASLRG